MINKLNGFTLSEVLIGVTVVGIIAALTIPNVISNHQKKTYLTSLKKVYTDLHQNLTLLQTENYRSKSLYKSKLNLSNGKTVDDTAGYFLKEYYKIKDDCGATAQPCFASKYKNIKGTSTSFTCTSYSVLLQSGAAICLTPTNDGPAKVIVDVNGTNKPNIAGRDLFTFYIYEDFNIDVVPPENIKDGTAETKRETMFNQNCFSTYTGSGCFAKILNDNWQMNY